MMTRPIHTVFAFTFIGLACGILAGCPVPEDSIAVPNLSGATRDQAEALLSDAGLQVGTVTEIHDHVVPAGQIFSQSPSAGTQVAEGSTVSFSISLGHPHGGEGEGEGEGEMPMRWSDPDTWGGNLPAAGEDVTIPTSLHVLLDVSPPPLGEILIMGTLEVEDRDLTLTAELIMVHGELRAGSEENPIESNVTFTLTGPKGDDIMGHGTRGIVMMDGSLELYGTPPAIAWTKLDGHAESGATTLRTLEDTGWQVGDEILIAPTDWYGVSETERRTITAVNGEVLKLDTPLSEFHWGRLQYVTPEGMSHEADGVLVPDHPDTPVILDERAEIGNLTRNIVIQAPDDTLWRDEGFGVHIMMMHHGSSARMDGVEIRRGGQRARIGRYPFHWHLLSYAGGDFLGEADGQFIRNSTINRSANRGIVVHGTTGVVVEDNVVFDTLGHGIFTEDAVERRNIFDHNLVLRVRNPEPFDALKQHEIFSEGGSSGFRISNPDNVVTNNAVADCQGFGYWLGFPATPWGPNHFVSMRPDRLPFGTFSDNSTHSTGAEGLMLDYVEIDNAGNVAPARYISTTDELDPVFPFGTVQRFDVSRISIWKSGRGGVWDYSTWPNYSGIVSADNVGRFFAGAGEDGLIEHSLVIGDSINSVTLRPAPFVEPLGGTEIPTAFATFQGDFDIRENLVVNFPLVPDERSGAFATDDYFLHPVEKGLTRNTANFLLGSHPGYRSRANQEHFALAGAVFDPEGLWGPTGQFIVYDEPFFTHGLPVSPIPPGEGTGGVSVPGPFYGIMNFVINNQRPPDHPLMALQATRLHPDSMAPIGTWTINEAAEEWFLSAYRHFAAHGSGLYFIEFPRSPMPTDLNFGFENMLEPEDTLVIGIQFSGAITPEVYVDAYERSRLYSAVDSLQAVQESSGETWWQDKPNGRVWVKLRGGFWEFWDSKVEHAVPTNDQLFYEKTTLHLNTD